MKNELHGFCEKHINHITQRDFIQGDHLKKTWTRFLAGDPDIRWQQVWLFVVLEYWMEKNNIS